MKRKNVTLKDIAKEAGISTTAVSKVLNNKGGISNKTKIRVIEIAERLGYRANFIAKSLKENNTKTLGLVVSDSSYAVFGIVIKGVEEAAAKCGYNIILASTNRNRETEMEAINILVQKRVDGLLLAASMLTKEEDVDFLNQLGVPYVFLFRRNVNRNIPYVGNDNIQGAFDIVDYMIKTGSKRIHFLNMSKDSTTSEDRLYGYKKALESNGLSYEPNIVYYMRPEIQESYTITRNLLEMKEQISAMFCGCDILCIGVMEAIFEKGFKIPGDIRVCGYDDIEFAAYLRRPLTTMRMPLKNIGIKGVELLINSINNNENYSKIIILKSELVVRQST